jgi:hypothetical protein
MVPPAGSSPTGSGQLSATGAEIPCSDAWRQLKAHPNIGSANLQSTFFFFSFLPLHTLPELTNFIRSDFLSLVLADVVARRTRCEPGPSGSASASASNFDDAEKDTQNDDDAGSSTTTKDEKENVKDSPVTTTTTKEATTALLPPPPPPSPADASKETPRLVPERDLIESAKAASMSRRLTVDRAGVAEALALLDRGFAKQ